MFRTVTIAAMVALVALTGCATKPQLPVALKAETLAPQARVGVALTAIPTADTYLPGAGCLLCLAAASVANSSLTTHTKSLSADDLGAVKAQVVESLKKKGVQVVAIDGVFDPTKFPELPREVNLSNRDYRRLQEQYKIDKLLIITVEGVGFQRNYASYIPTSDPRAWVKATGYVVDLRTNAYDWWQPVEVLRPAQGKWDEPPRFPGLTNAYYEAIELAKEQLLQPLQ
ncbi:hypothetical protein SAMN05216359_105231 [Roseateles sp. YR242]|uniref:hypothetical protein n=1 Tax=Roseateles sp. YR242 TaxID=1855305 RepID=UPI0008ABE7CF|nr:hypothetical protein [Roseateles sp. YR242]SEL11167.1 hypothetical protein SAMN05216359_105231 [Roseateles sp. YR242]